MCVYRVCDVCVYRLGGKWAVCAQYVCVCVMGAMVWSGFMRNQTSQTPNCKPELALLLSLLLGAAAVESDPAHKPLINLLTRAHTHNTHTHAHPYPPTCRPLR